MTEEERYFALCTLIQYYRIKAARSSAGALTLEALAIAFGIERKFLSNFLGGLSRDKRETAAHHSDDIQKVREGLRKWFDERGRQGLPGLIERAASLVLDHEESDRIDNIFHRLADTRPESINTFNKAFPGVYDIWRYAAHEVATYRPVPNTDGTRNYWVAHAALQIFPADPGHPYPRFEIRFRSSKRGTGRDFNTTFGEIAIIQRHLYFIGREDGTSYPLVVVARYNARHNTDFRGFVIRSNHNSSSLFAARVMFVKNNTAESINDIDKDLYIELDKNIADKIKGFEEEILNTVDHEGHGGLIL